MHELRETAYQTVVRPVLEYCSPIWSPWCQKDINRVESVHRAGARFVLNRPHRRDIWDSVTTMLNELKWSSLEERRNRASVTFLYKTVNGLTAIPQPYIPQLATIPANARTTRSLAKPQTRVQQRAYVDTFRLGLMNRSVKLWNGLPSETASAPSLEALV